MYARKRQLCTKKQFHDKIFLERDKMDCLFCKIAKKEIKSNILYEDEDIMAFLDIDQKISGHTLVIPKKHVTDYMELNNEIETKMFDVAKKLQPTLMTNLGKTACTLSMNYGDAQIIKHVHLHILPHLFHENSSLTEEEVMQKIKGED